SRRQHLRRDGEGDRPATVYDYRLDALERMGVVCKSNIPENRQDKVYFSFSSPSTASYVIRLFYKGREKPVVNMDLLLEDLLERKHNKIEILDLEYVHLSVVKLLEFLERKFSRRLQQSFPWRQQLCRRRGISTFHIDNTARGKLQPYLGAITLVSTVAGLVVVGIGGLYVLVNRHLDSKYPTPAEVTNRTTRRLLRGAALREHIAPNPQIAYMFLLRALTQLYKDGFAEQAPVVQETIVRLATAADKMGERQAAEQMLRGVWENTAGDDVWRDGMVARVARVLGPLLTARGAYEESVDVYGAAVQALGRLEAGGGDLDALHLDKANLITSLAEVFALAGDCDSAEALLSSVLVDIRARPQLAVDSWTCLDAVVMLDLAQVCDKTERHGESAAWANSALKVTRGHPGVWACDNCESHTLLHLGRLAEKAEDKDSAHVFYSRALDLARRTNTGNIEEIKDAIKNLVY
ncbi:RasGAP protein, partial [Coemansia sp. RSA 1836]